jgi:hypothetical protein
MKSHTVAIGVSNEFDYAVAFTSASSYVYNIAFKIENVTHWQHIWHMNITDVIRNINYGIEILKKENLE